LGISRLELSWWAVVFVLTINGPGSPKVPASIKEIGNGWKKTTACRKNSGVPNTARQALGPKRAGQGLFSLMQRRNVWSDLA
jgi:hypothetical protein